MELSKTLKLFVKYGVFIIRLSVYPPPSELYCYAVMIELYAVKCTVSLL